jgi:hypothetical protein
MIFDSNVIHLRAETTLELRALATRKPLRVWAPGERIERRAIAFSVDDTVFAVRDKDRVRVHAGSDGAVVREVSVGTCTGALAVTSARDVAIACADHVLLARATGEPTPILRGGVSTRLAFVGTNRLLAVGERVALWDLERNELRGDGKLLQDFAQREDEEEREELPWTYLAPNAPKNVDQAAVPQIRVGHTSSIVPRTSMLAPPPRIGTTGAILSLEGHDWQSLVVQDDLVRYALVDQLVPAEPPERCLSRVGGERHAVTSLDNGERVLVDQQELPVGLDAAPPEGYRHTTTAELPVRQLRPLVAAEVDACLIWGSTFGAHRTDAGAIAPFSGAASDGKTGLVVVGVRDAHRIGRDGKRATIAVHDNPQISHSGAYIASIEPTSRTVTITEVATGATVRTFQAPVGVPHPIEWKTKDVVYAFSHLIAVDPAVPPRVYVDELVTDPRSSIGAMAVDGKYVVVQDVATGKQLARHDGPADGIHVVPDDTGRIVIKAGTKLELVDLAGKRTVLPPIAGDIVGLGLSPGLLVAHQKSRSDAWDLATTQLLAIPASANLVSIVDDTLWMLDGRRKTTLVRVHRDGSDREELVLSTSGVPFHHIVDEVTISDDRKRLAARYAVNEELFAYAVWDLETGALLWVGPPSSTIVDDWLVAGGRAYIPDFGIDAVLRDTGARTNLRVCEKDLRVVPVTPPPASDTYWAPEQACTAPRR